MIEPVPLTATQNTVVGLKKNRLKRKQNEMRELIWWIGRFRIGRFPVETLLGTRSELGTQPLYEAPGDLRVEISQIVVVNVGLVRLPPPSTMAQIFPLVIQWRSSVYIIYIMCPNTWVATKTFWHFGDDWRAHGFHDYVFTYVLCPSCFFKIWALCV